MTRPPRLIKIDDIWIDPLIVRSITSDHYEQSAEDEGVLISINTHPSVPATVGPYVHDVWEAEFDQIAEKIIAAQKAIMEWDDWRDGVMERIPSDD